MTHDIDRLLAEACDDHDRPLHHTIDNVVRRGRRRARVRRTTEVTAGAVVAGAVATGLVTLGGGGTGDLPVGGPTGSAPTDQRTEPRTTSHASTAPTVRRQAAQPPANPVSDAEVRRRCAPLDTDSRQASSNKAGGGTDPVRDWTVVLSQGRDHWFQSILVSDDGKRYALCQDATRETEPYDELVREAVALTKEDYKVYVSNAGSWGPLPDRVARLTFRTPDGTVSDARVSGGFYLWYTNLRWLDLKGKPVWATFYDASGRQLARFNANPYVPEATPYCPGTTPRCSLSTPTPR